MSNFFNPGSPKFRRGVFLLSVYSCSLLSVHMIMADYGTQDHVFTPLQAYINRKMDKFFNVTHEDLYGKPGTKQEQISKPVFAMKRIDIKNDDKGK